MAENYQTELQASRLYRVQKKAPPNGVGELMQPSIWLSDQGSLYRSNSLTEPNALSDMTLTTADTDVTGNIDFGYGSGSVPIYMAITGTITEIVATGLDVIDLGSIS